MTDDAGRALLDVVSSTVKSCTRCWMSSSESCTAPIPYEGPVPAKVVIVGEAPSSSDDHAQYPFADKHGALMREMLREARIPERVVGFCYTVCCYGGQGKNKRVRVPTIEEIYACSNNLKMQLAVAKPTVVVLAGKTALYAATGRDDIMVSKDRGRPLVVDGFGTVAIPTFHPATAYKAKHLRRDMVLDLKQARYRMVNRNPWVKWPETCRVCGDDGRGDGRGIVYDEHGVCWCYDHAPKHEVEASGAVPMTLI